MNASIESVAPQGLITDILSGTGREAVWSVVALTCGVLILFKLFLQKSPISNLPSLSKDNRWTDEEARAKFRSQARTLIANGFKKFAGPFNLMSETGPITMLGPEYIDAINQQSHLSFTSFIRQNMLSQYDTFKSFRGTQPGLFEEAVMKGLTRSLPKFTKPLSRETSDCLDETWGDAEDWHSVSLRGDVLSWVARLSSRIFNGPDLASNKDWLRISIEYTVNSFKAIEDVKKYPPMLRYFAERTLPICRSVRRDYQTASNILQPMLAARRAEIVTAQKEGRKPNLPDDSTEWFRNASKGRSYDETQLQIGLGVAAIHTTSDLLGQAIINLALHPELVEPLRKEAVDVLNKFGLEKVALTELRLLDSFFKETQRLKPVGISSMHRLATADVSLPNGIKIPAGSKTAISSHLMWDENTYPNPNTFDGYRFLERRKIPGYENKSLLVSTSNDHLAFSHGKHACPGRFFAANEVKIAMLQLLLKYDVRLDSRDNTAPIEYGITMLANPMAKVSVRRRKEEIDVDALSVE